MKKQIFLLASLVSAIVLSLPLVACSDDDDEEESVLVSDYPTWYQVVSFKEKDNGALNFVDKTYSPDYHFVAFNSAKDTLVFVEQETDGLEADFPDDFFDASGFDTETAGIYYCTSLKTNAKIPFNTSLDEVEQTLSIAYTEQDGDQIEVTLKKVAQRDFYKKIKK